MPEEKTGAPRRSSAVAGAGTGRTPWAHLTVPLPMLSAEQYQRVGGERFDGDRSADDVHDGVFRADLVEVDGLGRAIVNLALGLGEQQKGFEREGLGSGADRGAGDDLADFGEAAMDMRVRRGWLRLVRVRRVRVRLVRVSVGVPSFVTVRVGRFVRVEQNRDRGAGRRGPG